MQKLYDKQEHTWCLKIVQIWGRRNKGDILSHIMKPPCLAQASVGQEFGTSMFLSSSIKKNIIHNK